MTANPHRLTPTHCKTKNKTQNKAGKNKKYSIDLTSVNNNHVLNDKKCEVKHHRKINNNSVSSCTPKFMHNRKNTERMEKIISRNQNKTLSVR